MKVVFIKHPGYGKNYVFEVPKGVELTKGDEVAVATRKGETRGVCVSDSFELDGVALEALAETVGGKLPLKPVVGRVLVDRFEENETAGQSMLSRLREPENIEAQLSDECALRAELERVKRERDAAVKDLSTTYSCEVCKYGEITQQEEPCKSCVFSEETRWEWRGPQVDSI